MPENALLIQALRDALASTPQNVVLRKHLAELLMQQKAYAEAEKEYRLILDTTPDDREVELLLARAFIEQEKWMIALVILEKFLQESEASASVLHMSVKVYVGIGNLKRAAEIYRKAVLNDPLSADPALEEKLQPYIKEIADTSKVSDERVRVSLENWMPQSNLPVERPKIAFDDVGGMEQLKEEIQIKIIHPLNHPEIYKAYGKSIGGGILLYGPPGCGKTLLARATAGEVNAFFLNIGIHDVLNMYLGQSEQNLHKLFEFARQYKPCVIFIDEIDALGANRADMQHSAGRYTINQLLVELDGIGASNDGILILAATNAPWHIDPALRRAGRFDQVIFVPPPDSPARSAILEVMLRDKPTQQLDLEQVTKRTAGFSGADLKAVVDRAIEDKLREALKRGVPSPLQTDDLIRAAKAVKPSTKDWFATARNYALYSNQSGIYDDVVAYLDKSDSSNPLSRFAFWRDE